jgi:hypothetical protein
MADIPGGPAARRGRRLHTVSGRACSSHTARPPAPPRRGPDRPLHVLGRAKGLLDALAQAGQLDRLGVLQARPRPQLARDLLADHPPRSRVEPVGERLLPNRARAQLHGHLVDGEPVGGDLALDDGGAEPVGGLDGDLRGVAVHRVEGE